MFHLRFTVVVVVFYMMKTISATDLPESNLSKRVVEEWTPKLTKEMDARGQDFGSELFIRIFKVSKELEVWVKTDSLFELFKTYKICTYGWKGLGPKTRQGDGYAPEGFYFVTPSSLNPWSSYHLAFNLGYPNAYDRAHNYTGGSLMVHGSCASIGCYAMTDKGIEEIYTLLYASFMNGQPFIRVHIFPFRMTEKELNRHKNSKWYNFWLNLKTGYDYFEDKKIPPNVEVKLGKYVFE
ncbi:L,D-transpeptidase family protein [Saccharicrinis sp. FJH54]|uniref:L,D-transpeptidase family protein n=1 Tax=Saccharicrinis sp. FJH54 TaxID=3344665 RepID=UPI0035D498A9